ncbi:MAG: hypothetical protein OXD35_05795 [Thiotrichales bacterium]|nr:hypothetical protein [Thiotrichales bacterium]
MRPENLYQNYPELYHIAWRGSWQNIEEYGLLSTKALLQLYGKDENEIKALTQVRRLHWVAVDCPGRRGVVIRDQKPLSDRGLRRALPDHVEPWQWYDLINSMVFFWPTKERLKTMIRAQAYKGIEHDVLIINTKKLVQLEESNIRLSWMNSGCTKPRAFPRDMDLFQQLEDYLFEDSRKRRGLKKAIAEVCVTDRVERIREVVTRVQTGSADEILRSLG